MGKKFERIDEDMRAWLQKQHLFFVSTAPLAGDGLINCSPKGSDCLRVLGEREVGYLDFTGSGVETISHLQENGRIVLMFCSFEQTPRIVRFHGKGIAYPVGSPRFDELIPNFEQKPGMRSIIYVNVTRISDSCGYGVPRYEFVGDRKTMAERAVAQGEEGILEYKRTRNAVSLDGLPGLVVETEQV